MKPRVLIVEDESAQAVALKAKFEHESFDVLTAKNGIEGIDVALAEKPDAIILDVMMPRMDGIQMAKKLREDVWGKDVPILILTNASEMGNVEEAMESGIFEYFVKSDTKIEHIVERVKEMTS